VFTPRVCPQWRGYGDIFVEKIYRLVAEAWLKSFMMCIVIAGAVSATVALILWFTPVSGVWYAVGTLLGLTAVLMPLFYFLRYRPDDMAIARRLDRMGLDERMITMTEFGTLSDEDNAMLANQRADAIKALDDSVSAGKKLTIAISGLAVIPVVAALALSGGMITVNALSDAEVIPGGNRVIGSIFTPEDEKFYTLNYRVVGLVLNSDGYVTEICEDEGGFIDGDEEQLVVQGGSAMPVFAEAEDDWLFSCWGTIDVTKEDPNDRYHLNADEKDPYREDLNIIADGANSFITEDGETIITYVAYYVYVPDSDGDSSGSDGENDPNEDQDAPQDAPGDGDDSQGGDDNNSSSGDNSNPDADDGDDGGGNYSSDKDNIIDGTQDYREVYEQYLKEALEIINNGGELPEFYKKIIEDYFGTIV